MGRQESSNATPCRVALTLTCFPAQHVWRKPWLLWAGIVLTSHVEVALCCFDNNPLVSRILGVLFCLHVALRFGWHILDYIVRVRGLVPEAPLFLRGHVQKLFPLPCQKDLIFLVFPAVLVRFPGEAAISAYVAQRS